MKLRHLKNKMYGSACSINHSIFVKDLQDAKQQNVDSETFTRNYAQWFCEDKNFKGIENFSYIDFCNGI